MKDTYKILLVDDSESDRGIYRGYLLADKNWDYQILEAGTLKEGLALWKTEFPDIVLADLNLPDGNGLELLQGIKEADLKQKCPVIVITGQGNERLAVQAMKLGASDYWVKEDITATTLCDSVETAILSEKLTKIEQFNQELQELQARVEERTHALEASQSFNRSILDAIPDLLLRLRRDGTCLSYIPPKVNKDSFQPITQHISEFLPPDLLERQLQAIEQAIITRELQVYEHQVLKNNQITYEEIRILAINDQTVLAIVRDISDRKAIEKNLEESRAKFQRLVDEMGEKFVVFSHSGVEGVVNYVSDGVYPIFGFSKEDVLGKHWAEVVNWLPEEIPKARTRLMSMLQGEQNFCQSEMRFIHPDGSIRTLQVSEHPVRNETGEFLAIEGIIEDISDRKQVEQENIRLRERFQFLLASSPAIIYSCKPYGDYGATFISDNTEAILGYQPEQFVTQENFWANHLHPEDAPQIFAELTALFEKETHTHEYRFLHQDGHYLWIRDQLQLVRDDQGNPIEIIGSLSDISDRKRAELQLQKITDRLSLALKSGAIGCWEWNLANNTGIWDERMYELYGVDKKSNSLKECEILANALHPDDRKSVNKLLRQAFLGEAEYDIEFRIVHPDSSIHFIKSYGTVIRDSQGNAQSMIGVNFDISDRKANEIKLKESQQFLQTVLDSFPLAVFWKDRESVLQGCNQFFAQISELDSPQEVVGKTNFDFSYTVAQAQGYLLDDQQVMESGISLVGIEETITLPTGETRWIETNKVPLRDLEGHVIGILGTFQDITERVENRQKLVNLTDRLKIALNSGAIGYWEWDIAHNTLTWDERLYELYGVPLGTTVLLETWMNSLHPDDRQPMATLTEQVMAGKAELNTEFRVIHPDRSIHFLKTYGLVMRDEGGNPLSVVGVNFDITEQKRAEKTIRQQIEKETLLRQITQHIRETLDLQTIFDTACQEIRQFIQTDRVAIFKFYPDSGYDDGEFVAESVKEGLPSTIAIPVHDHCFGENHAQRYVKEYFLAVTDVLHSDLQDCYKAVLRQFNIRANLVIPLLVGKELWGLLCIHNCIAPRIWEPDEIDLIQQIAGQIAIAIQQADLFEQLQQKQQKLTQTNQALIRSNEDLARATRLKDEFLANMSHELRTPLTAILGMSEALQENIFGDINPGQEKALKLIEKSGEHLLTLITDILDLSKIEAGKLELKLASTSVQMLCENSTMFVRQMAFTKKIALQTRIAENIEQIWVDELRIRQSLINLLSNAIKFTPSGGSVILSVELEEQDILFSVTDTGIGISPTDLDKLFQRFVQIDSSLNRQYAGTGLGLVLVERIITKHGGRVSVTSRAGEGSCFTLRLPYLSPSRDLVPEKLETDSFVIKETNSPLLVSPLILLADDDEGNRKTLDDYLSNKGYRVLLAYNGREAVEMVKAHQPDLILMDIQMPVMDGLEATNLIRSDSAIAHIPIIALTALALFDQTGQYLGAGSDEYLMKPVRFKVLIETIQKYCQRHED